MGRLEWLNSKTQYPKELYKCKETDHQFDIIVNPLTLFTDILYIVRKERNGYVDIEFHKTNGVVVKLTYIYYEKDQCKLYDYNTYIKVITP